MAEKCTHCEWKLKESDNVVACPNCGALYHEKCWNTLVVNCSKCGAYTALGVKYASVIETQKHHKEEQPTQQPKGNPSTASMNNEFQRIRENVDNTLNNEQTGLFANIGEKIKAWAKRIFVVGVIFGIITFLAIAIDGDWDSVLAALGAGLGIVLTAWTTALLLYAFGELVHNSAESKKIQQQILEELRNKKE